MEYLPALEGECQLPVHKNKTQFAASDMLVPWNLKTQANASSNKTNKEEKKPTDQKHSEPTSNGDNQTTSQNGQPEDVGQKPDSQLFHRYYHIFREGELESLCLEIEGCKIVRSYFDQGNWCVIVTKI